ncbi:MAG: ribosome assembly RNA-binding protein YhbY [Treponema sp.]|uniref:ribosome assembly RNA-binding protein YhbY n=1 Tax=Treponema sp. TaxID=166 RepID=UPI00298E3A76|nr:ribosome assembly RNA-binding protein YhbY [Treponema sp.]MBR0154665.1 ribosome assembly RNA-binding protein YhbY [Treponema sp.]MCR5387322.1 ribosome assembly RNA-binding protein YhbY [Treponema sp.]
MIEMTSAARKELSSRAHNLHPVVIIGQNGVTDGVIGKINESLKAHELIKVKFLEFKDEKQELAQEIVEKTESQLVRIIGNIAILYKENEEKKENK